jgi:threonine aldolase
VVAIENTHNSAGGRVFPIDEARAISKVARDGGASLHLDGARIFNAQVATGVPAREWAACVDTVTFCFSKGLGAPIGSMVVGSEEVISKAHVLRKRLGGGMRQVGVIAAAARIALESGIERLAEDHDNARKLASGLAELDATCVDVSSVETNMVFLDLAPFGRQAPEVAAGLKQEGVLVNGFPGSSIRLVTHRDVDPAGISSALEAIRKILA